MLERNGVILDVEPDPDDQVASPLRVTHVVLSLDTGGLERIVLDLVRFGRAQGHSPSVICLERPGKLATEVETLAVPVLRAQQTAGIAVEHGSIGCDFLLRELEARRRAHPSDWRVALHGTGFARRERKSWSAVVHTEHINNVAKSRSLNKKIRTRLLWRLAGMFADRFCCVSEDIADAVKAYGTVARHKVNVVLNGIDTAAFDSTGDSETLRK